MTLRVLLVGCGDMAGGYDSGRDPADWPLSHAGALRRHAAFDLVACVDPDEGTRAAFQDRWGVARGFAALEDIGDEPFDVVVVVSATPAHADALAWSLDRAPRLVFCEKPLTDDLDAARRLVDTFETAGVPLAVNFSRTWDTSLDALDDLGAVLSVGFTYSGSVLNSASHFVDLVARRVGPLEVEWVGEGRPDGGAPFALRAGDVPIVANVAPASRCDVFTVEFQCERGVLRYDDSGFAPSVRRVENHPHHPGRRALGPAVPIEPGYPPVLMRAYDRIEAHLERGEPLDSTGRTALATQTVCARIMELSA
ncbi:MAG: Gfo/Idh/MocA family oxidoreductase [Planctomycetota bacterium]